MVTKRPHILTYESLAMPGGEDPNGFPLPDVPGALVEVPCRFHLDSSKVYKNEDSTETQQIGTVRIDPGVFVPNVGTVVTVVDLIGNVQFSGPVRERYEAQKSGRLGV